MSPLVHPQTAPARTHATSRRQRPEPAPKPARSARGPLGTGRTIDGGTYNDPGRYVDMIGGGNVVPLLLGFVVSVVDELLMLRRENERGRVGGAACGMLVLLPMPLSLLLSLGEGGREAVVLLLLVDRRRKTPLPLPLPFDMGGELVVASHMISAFVGESARKVGLDIDYDRSARSSCGIRHHLLLPLFPLPHRTVI